MDNYSTNLWQDHRVRVVSLAVLALLAAFLLVQTVNSIKAFQFIGADTPLINTVTVTGEGEVFAVPDIATFTFSVIEERANASEAQDAAAQKTNSILSFVKEQGVEERDIKTTNFSLFPRYEFRREAASGSVVFPPSGERVLVGFEVNQTVSVKVRDTGKAGQLIAGVSELGARGVSGLAFTIDDEDALKAGARADAIADARTKAKALADELDVKLVRIVSFGEFDEPIFFARNEAFGFGGDTAVSTQAVAPELPGGENRIVSRVNITYEIR